MSSLIWELCTILRVEDIDIEEYRDPKKRSGFTDGLLKAGEKLLDGSLGGFFIEMVKKLANRVI